MDAALKQRLIGAAVLVALAVIFLPMLVDGPEPQTGTSAVPLDIPAPPERSFETRELPVAPATPSPAAATPASADPDRIVTIEAENAKPPEAMPEDLAPVAVSAPNAAVAAPPPSTPPGPATPGAAPPPAAITTPLPAATAPAAPAPATGALPAAAPGGRYVVNLGSYGNTANADALVASMKRAGLPAYADNVALGGKAARRVRVGPFAQKGEAEAARLAATRVRADVAAAVVAIDSDEAAASPAPARAPVATGFAVQLGALKTEADANALRDKARGAGFTAYVERADTEAGALFRVRVGPELQRVNAEALKTQIKQKLAIDGVVVTQP
jgi:DedD protein